MAMFKGFKPQGMQKIASRMGYAGRMEEFDSYLQQNPDKQREMLVFQEKAQQMAKGGVVRKFAEGGLEAGTQAVVYGPDGTQYGNGMIAEQAGVTDVSYTRPIAQQPVPVQSYADNATITDVAAQRMSAPALPSGGQSPDPRQLTQATVPTLSADPYAATDTIGDVSAKKLQNPSLPTGGVTIPVGTQIEGQQLIDPSLGTVSGTVGVPTAQASTTTANQGTASAANLVTADDSAAKVDSALAATTAAQTTPDDPRSQVVAAEQAVSSVSSLTAAQGNATLMTNPVQRKILDGELVSGVANAETASAYAEQIQAATATPTTQATVQGQLASLTDNFDASNPPAWAAGALRGVQAQMAARGLGASSMAGQAMVQAALESALPIAQADAQVTAQFEAQNLSNRQQRAMLSAQQRATFIGQEFDQGFQARVQNAAKIGDIANMNFTAEQNIALENSRAANTMNLNNLSNKQAMIIAEASALSNMDMSNLNNRQQSAVQNAQSFMQMDMANLSNTQQGNMFNAQQRIQSLFTDTAATNASKQFNATSKNQVDQFFSNLGQQANQFNATQVNAQEQFNAGQSNTVERFNAELNNARDTFNAQNQQVIAQSNANWRRQIASSDTVAVNRANELNAQAVLGISNQAYNNLWQYYGDTMEWAWTSAENERSRVVDLAKAQLNADADADIQGMKNDYNSSAAFGGLMTKFIGGALGF